jgi:hypothetical protein
MATKDRSDKEKITIIKAMKIPRKIEAKGFMFLNFLYCLVIVL